MKRSTILNFLFLSLLLSSCGLIEKFKTSETPTDSNNTTSEAAPLETKVDDLFSSSMNSAENNIGTDAPSNVTTNNESKNLESEFSANGPADSQIKEVATTTPEAPPIVEPQKEEALNFETQAESTPQAPVVVAEEKLPAPTPEAPMKQEETIPEIKSEVANNSTSDFINPEAGKINSYKVQKGETLMQIAFKIYGDIGKWKELKNLNHQIVSRNSALKKGTEIKYKVPEKEFVWNPEGTAYMIRTGETLGIISNNVYQTPKKWRKIWENNKPLIKNPNVIYAGFTLYYKNEGMANYVQPKKEQNKKIISKNKTETINVEESLSHLEQLDSTTELQSSTLREVESSAKTNHIIDQEVDEALIEKLPE